MSIPLVKRKLLNPLFQIRLSSFPEIQPVLVDFRKLPTLPLSEELGNAQLPFLKGDIRTVDIV